MLEFAYFLFGVSIGMGLSIIIMIVYFTRKKKELENQINQVMSLEHNADEMNSYLKKKED